jgi:hypothetical protein
MSQKLVLSVAFSPVSEAQKLTAEEEAQSSLMYTFM